MIWYVIPLLISLAGLVLALHGLGWLPRFQGRAGSPRDVVRWGRVTAGTLLFLAPLFVSSLVFLLLETRAQQQFEYARAILDLHSLDAEFPDAPAILRHEQSSSATDYQNIARILQNTPGTLALLHEQGTLELEDFQPETARNLLSRPGVDSILEHLQTAAHKVRFWHATAEMSGNTREITQPPPNFPQTIKLTTPLLLHRAQLRLQEDRVSEAYTDLARAFRLSAQLCGSPIYWQREAGETLLGQSLDCQEWLGQNGPMPAAKTLERVHAELAGISALSAFDESVLRSLLQWDEEIFEPEVSYGELEKSLPMSLPLSLQHMPLDRWEPPLRLSHTALRGEVLSAVSQLHEHFHQKPLTLARADLLSHLEPVIARAPATAVAERLQGFQERLLDLETRRRLAQAATSLYIEARENPGDYLKQADQHLQELPREVLLDPRSFALMTTDCPEGRPPFLTFEEADKGSISLRMVRRWQLAPASAFADDPPAPEPAITPQPAPETIAKAQPREPRMTRRRQLLTAARLLQRQKTALNARKPDPAKATPEELERWQQDFQTWQDQVTRLKKAAREL